MPVKPTYPGVYIEEIPSGVRSITGVSTSVAAFVDGFARGVLNRPVQLFSLSDLERELGGLDKDSAASYAVQQFFLNGGTECWVVRVGQGGIAASNGALLDSASPAVATLNVKAGRRIRDLLVEDPGVWGDNLHLEVDYDTADPTTLFNLTVSEIVDSGGRKATRRSETFRNLSNVPGAASNAIEVVNDGSRLVQLVPATIPWALPAATGTYGTALTASIAAATHNLSIDVRPTGTGAPSSVAASVLLALPTAPVDAAPLLQEAIRAAGAGLAEDIRPLLAGATVKAIRTAPGQWRFHVLAGRGSRTFDPRATLTVAGAGAAPLGLAAAIVRPQLVKLGGGSRGTMPITDPNVLIGAPGAGLNALDEVDLFNILCIPQAAELANQDHMRQVYLTAAQYAESRRAFLIVDVPGKVKDLAGMQAWMGQNDSLRHRNAAVYFPRTRIPDPLNDSRPRSIGASGTIAGLYARTDTERGVWKAPAGTDARLRNVLALDSLLTDPQNGALNPIGVNCLRSFPVYSNICWGARTLDGADAQASEWKYVPVRRLTLFIEESLYRGTKWVVFEPNDEPLWAQIRLNVGAFMHTLFRQGAFQGTTPREAYLVKCDRETTPQADIDIGIVNILVGFLPLKPAEFVIIMIQQKAGDIQT
jgi:phage tail sheath protein FI